MQTVREAGLQLKSIVTALQPIRSSNFNFFFSSSSTGKFLLEKLHQETISNRIQKRPFLSKKFFGAPLECYRAKPLKGVHQSPQRQTHSHEAICFLIKNAIHRGNR